LKQKKKEIDRKKANDENKKDYEQTYVNLIERFLDLPDYGKEQVLNMIGPALTVELRDIIANNDKIVQKELKAQIQNMEIMIYQYKVKLGIIKRSIETLEEILNNSKNYIILKNAVSYLDNLLKTESDSIKKDGLILKKIDYYIQYYLESDKIKITRKFEELKIMYKDFSNLFNKYILLIRESNKIIEAAEAKAKAEAEAKAKAKAEAEAKAKSKASAKAKSKAKAKHRKHEINKGLKRL
jgi:hypothetical protein